MCTLPHGRGLKRVQMEQRAQHKSTIKVAHSKDLALEAETEMKWVACVKTGTSSAACLISLTPPASDSREQVAEKASVW